MDRFSVSFRFLLTCIIRPILKAGSFFQHFGQLVRQDNVRIIDALCQVTNFRNVIFHALCYLMVTDKLNLVIHIPFLPYRLYQQTGLQLRVLLHFHLHPWQYV